MRIKRLDRSTVCEFESSIRERLGRDRNTMWGYYAHPGLVDFHWSRLLASCESDSVDVWNCVDGSGPVLLFGLGKHESHTQVFKTMVGRVGPLYRLSPDMDLVQNALKRCAAKGKSLGLQILTLRVPASGHFLNYCLSTLGWSHVGTSAKLAIDRDQWAKCYVDTDFSTIYSSCLSGDEGAVGLREAGPSDAHQLAGIISRAHRHSHFFNDPHLPEAGRNSLFPVWIERSVNGMMDLVLVAEKEGDILGFASCLVSRGLQEFVGHEVGALDFIAVDPAAQGQGIGKRLLNAVFAWLFQRVPVIELRTMVDNTAALTLYSRLGMVPVGSDHHYHCWLSMGRRTG
ncbi:MAG: GNAT family N-acetyltransferase [bacterium]